MRRSSLRSISGLLTTRRSCRLATLTAAVQTGPAEEKYGVKHHHFMCYVLYRIGEVGEDSLLVPAGEEEALCRAMR